MSRFARTPEEAFLRHKELAEKKDENGQPKTDDSGVLLPAKGALQTFFLYQLILMHSWETGVLNKKFKELCELYGLDLDNSYRRLKILRRMGWIANTTKYIRPLIIHRAGDSKTVKITDKTNNGTVKITDETGNKTVIFTDDNCKNYSEIDENAVKITVENDETSIPISHYDDSKTSLNLKNDLNDSTAAHNPGSNFAEAAAETNFHKSIFSISECLRYANICKSRGEPIKSVEALANSAYRTGNLDAFIQATLYSEQPEQITAASFDDDDLTDALAILRDVQELGDDVNEMEKYYSPEVWKKLMGELHDVE